jgi:hypothetical protein
MTRAFFLAMLLALANAAGAQAPERATEELRAEMVFWESVRSSSDPADFRAYLEQYPNGKFAALARNRLSALNPQPAIPAPATAPAAAPPAPRASGSVSVGDTWTYRVAQRGAQGATQEVRVASVTADGLVEEILGDGPALRAEHRRGAYLVPAGKLTLFSPYLPILQPLSLTPGLQMRVDNFDARTCNAGWTCSARARVLGRERVQVPAGAFDATRIEIAQSWTSPSQTNDRGESVQRTMTVWYAPEVKRAVRTISRGTPSAFVDTQYELELTSYQVK